MVKEVIMSMYEWDYYKAQKYQMQAPYKIHKLLLKTPFGYMGMLFQNNEEVYEFNQFLQFEPKEVYKLQPENENNKYSVSLEPG